MLFNNRAVLSIVTNWRFTANVQGMEKNNGNNRQYRNKIVCVGCTERTLAVSIFGYYLVYAV